MASSQSPYVGLGNTINSIPNLSLSASAAAFLSSKDT